MRDGSLDIAQDPIEQRRPGLGSEAGFLRVFADHRAAAEINGPSGGPFEGPEKQQAVVGRSGG